MVGNWGASTIAITSLVAADPANIDVSFSQNDTITVRFNQDTNMASMPGETALTKEQVGTSLWSARLGWVRCNCRFALFQHRGLPLQLSVCPFPASRPSLGSLEKPQISFMPSQDTRILQQNAGSCATNAQLVSPPILLCLC